MGRGKLAIFTRQRAPNRLAKAAWANLRKDASSPIISHDRVVAHALEQTATDAGVRTA